jgi:CRISPR-associated protein Csm2
MYNPNFNGNSRPGSGQSYNGSRQNGGNQWGSQSKSGYHGSDNEETPKQIFDKANYQSSWITNEADSNLVDFAEKMGIYMANNGLTNSKIRSIYGEIKRIQMGEFEKEKASFFLLRPKVAYALGRDDKNKGLLLFKIIFDACSKDVSNQKTYQNFCNLLEAILAYHRANGGKD